MTLRVLGLPQQHEHEFSMTSTDDLSINDEWSIYEPTYPCVVSLCFFCAYVGGGLHFNVVGSSDSYSLMKISLPYITTDDVIDSVDAIRLEAVQIIPFVEVSLYTLEDRKIYASNETTITTLDSTSNAINELYSYRGFAPPGHPQTIYKIPDLQRPYRTKFFVHAYFGHPDVALQADNHGLHTSTLIPPGDLFKSPFATQFSYYKITFEQVSASGGNLWVKTVEGIDNNESKICNPRSI